jgi:hypothetical protein
VEQGNAQGNVMLIHNRCSSQSELRAKRTELPRLIGNPSYCFGSYYKTYRVHRRDPGARPQRHRSRNGLQSLSHGDADCPVGRLFVAR